MKNLRLWVLSLVLLILTGCIPSLHGIVTEADQITDDRILGLWSMNDAIIPTVHIKDSGAPSPDTNMNLETSDAWLIERVATIAYQVELEDGVGSGTIVMGTRSHLPPGAEIISEKIQPGYFLTDISLDGADTIRNEMIVRLTTIGDQIFMDFMPHKGNKDFDSLGRFYSNILPTHTFAKMTMENGILQVHPFRSEYVEELLRNKRIRLKHEVLEGDGLVLTAKTEALRSFIEKYADDGSLYESSWFLSPM